VGWELLLASFKAVTVEEIVNRFFLMTLLVWLGKFFFRDADGHPTKWVYWVAILLTGLLFGWAHVDARLGNPEMPLWGLMVVMVLNTGLGVYFGWSYWRLGLEWAILAHFLFDVFLSMVLVPVYLLKNPFVWIFLIAGLGSVEFYPGGIW
jgi:membrane protease YdiL (CAAX protease family)